MRSHLLRCKRDGIRKNHLCDTYRIFLCRQHFTLKISHIQAGQLFTTSTSSVVVQVEQQVVQVVGKLYQVQHTQPSSGRATLLRNTQLGRMAFLPGFGGLFPIM